MSILFVVYNLIFLTFFAVIAENAAILLVGGIGLMCLICCCRGTGNGIYKTLIVCTTISFLFLFLVYFGNIERYGIPYYGGDDQVFEAHGHNLYLSGVKTFSDIPYIKGMWYAKGYLLVIAQIERLATLIGEYSTFLPRIVNLYLWHSTAVLTFKRFRKKINDSDLAKKALFILAVFPNALYISSHVYRDTLVTFLIVILIYSFEDLVDSFQKFKAGQWVFIHIVLLAVCFYMLYYIRMQMCYCVLAVWAFKFFSGRRELSNINPVKKYVAVFGTAFVALVILQATGALDLLVISSGNYSAYRYDQNSGLSRIIFSLPVIPFGIFARFIWGLVSPFPGGILSLPFFEEMIYSLMMLLVYLGTVFQIVLVPYLVKSVLKLDYKSLRFLVIFGAIITTTFTFRHFIMVYPFAAELILREYERTSTVKKKNNIIYVALLCAFLAMLYLIYILGRG